MSLLKLVVTVSLLVSFIFSSEVYSTPTSKWNKQTISVRENTMNYENELQKFLEKQSKENYEDSYSFTVTKKNYNYIVIIKSKNSLLKKHVPAYQVENLFQEKNGSAKKTILDIIFKPGKK